MDLLRQWHSQNTMPQVLDGAVDLDMPWRAAPRIYGWAKAGRGIRIRGGTARSYYVGIETAGLAIPGAPRPLKALCVVPFGMEEGTRVRVPSDAIGLVVGEPCSSGFSALRVRQATPLAMCSLAGATRNLAETDPWTNSACKHAAAKRPMCPCSLNRALQNWGMFELWCVNTMADQRWKLEFSVRQDAEAVPDPQEN